MKIAIIHDHLIQDGGAEQVLRVLQTMWPEAPTYTLVFDASTFPDLKEKDVRTSFMQRLPMSLRRYQWYIALMPTATESYDLRGFDVVVSSSSAFSKGILTHPGTIHVCYCHTPTRYLWSDAEQRVQELSAPGFVKALLRPLLSSLRVWDRQAAERVDYFIANSSTVQSRIQKYYNRDSEVIYPPVDVSRFEISHEPKTYFLAGGRLVASKRFDLIVEAANKTGIAVKIFGSGPEEARLRAMAKPNVEFLGRVSAEEQARLYANARAYLHPQLEDFGIAAVESMAAGRPVIAFGEGGATETVIDGVTGEFFTEQSWEELADHLIRFDDTRYIPEHIRAHAQQFSTKAFTNALTRFIERVARPTSPTTDEVCTSSSTDAT